MTFRQIVNHLNHRDTPLLPKNKIFRFSLILVTILFISLTTKYIFAATTSNPYLDKSDAIKSGNNQESWLNEALSSNLVSLFNGITGGIPKEVFQAYESGGGPQYAYVPGGAFGNMNNMIAALYTPAASGIEYIAEAKDKFLGKPAYAQGVGFTGLQFLLPLWRGFRNLIYVISSLVFVGIGIMIMLRVKISPQAVITVQSAIPQLITTLILVTFSYAIAGLVIDICNLLQAVIVAILFSVQGKGLNESLFQGFWWGSGFPIISDILNAFGALFTPENFTFSSLSNPTLRDMQMLTSRATPGWLSLTMLGGLLGSIITGFFLGGVGSIFGSTVNFVGDIVGRGIGGAVGGLVGALIIPIILCIIVGIWLIKLYFGLIKCYVTLIFKIVLGPLEIGAGAFPNAKIGFNTWILDVVANMAVFPIIGIFLVLLNILVDAIAGGGAASSTGVFSSPVWSPNLISANGIISPSILAACVGLAGLALLSKLPEMVPQFIFMIKPSPFGQAIGENLDFSKSRAWKTAETVGKSQVVGPIVKEAGSRMGSNTFLNKFTVPFTKGQGLGTIAGKAVENTGQLLKEGKL